MGTHIDPDDERLLTAMGLLIEAQAGLAVEFDRRLEGSGLVTGQPFGILLRLLRSQGHRLRMSDLAAQTTLTASGLTRAVDRLERAGLVARAACPEDRRVSYAALTPAGEDAITAALPVHAAHVGEVLRKAFTVAELDDFERLMRRLRDTVNPAAACASLPGGTPEGALPHPA